MTDQTPTNPGGQNVQWTADKTQIVSLNTFVTIDIGGEPFKVQVTTRNGATAERIVENFKHHIEALTMIRQEYPAKSVSYPADPFDEIDRDFPPLAQPAQPHAAPASNGNGNSFKAGRLSVEVQDGKASYKLAAANGERFPKFPVRVWPEVLTAAGVNLSAINPLDANTCPDFAGWTAEYEKNEQGNPRKVTRLYR